MGNFARVHVTNGRQKKLFKGHPWVYRNEIAKIEGDYVNGDEVTVLDFRGKTIGHGLINDKSMLTVRILTKGSVPITESLIESRVKDAIDYRMRFLRSDTDSCRLIFGEADLLPGVIADKYGNVVMLQTLSLGMAKFEKIIAETIIREISPSALVLNNMDRIRLLEGLEQFCETFYGELMNEVIILENGVKLKVDLVDGQKTGYFLDQKENHLRLRKYCMGKKVLDCFTYIGGFAMNAAMGGASEVVAVDISEQAISLTEVNAALNGFENIKFVCANAFDLLRDYVASDEKFDVIVLDPPAFTKKKSTLESAVRGYKEINLSAMKLLPKGGILATHSCSYHMPEDVFVETVFDASVDLGRRIRIIELCRQDFDHPVLAGYPESHYLKSLWIEMMD